VRYAAAATENQIQIAITSQVNSVAAPLPKEKQRSDAVWSLLLLHLRLALEKRIGYWMNAVQQRKASSKLCVVFCFCW